MYGLAVTLALAVLGLLVEGARAEDFDCLIEPNVVASVAFAVEGQIESVAVDRGDLVRSGQVLARLESGVEKATLDLAAARVELEAALKSNEVRLEFGVRRFVRTQEMFRKDLVPIKEMDEAETAKVLAEVGVLEAKENRRLAELELVRSREVLQQKVLRSPISGVVMERLLTPGEYAKTPVLKLAEIDPLRVEVIVPVAQLNRVTIGTRAEIVPEAPVGGTYGARVKVVDRVVDAASGTFGVRLELPNPGHRLPAGLKCRVRFLR
jgi:RND family efflux transporter MFP subunit